MNITVYLGANEGNDPALKQAVQELVTDMEKIANRMDENFEIATDLKKETAIFTKI